MHSQAPKILPSTAISKAEARRAKRMTEKKMKKDKALPMTIPATTNMMEVDDCKYEEFAKSKHQ